MQKQNLPVLISQTKVFKKSQMQGSGMAPTEPYSEYGDEATGPRNDADENFLETLLRVFGTAEAYSIPNKARRNCCIDCKDASLFLE